MSLTDIPDTPHKGENMIDILIRNAEIIDGSKALRYRGDIAITEDKITDIGSFGDASAHEIIDAADRVVLPGFIDMHSHGDLTLLAAPESESLIRQGITTIVGGQCGLSPAPMNKMNKREAVRTINIVGAPKTKVPLEKVASFGVYLDYMEEIKPAVNLVPLVGHGMIRSAVLGYQAGRANDFQIARMQELIREAMDSGAFGISTGLIYPPGSFTSTEELIQVAKPAAEFEGIYFSHIRGEAGTLLEAIREAIQIGEGAGLPVQISHYKAGGKANWDNARLGLELIDKARRKGQDISMDMYPYNAGSTHLAALLPAWAVEGGVMGVFRRLLLPWERRKIIQAMKAGEGEVVEAIEWDKILVSKSRIPAYSLKYIADLAAAEGKDPYHWTLNAIVKTLGDISMVIILMSEENIRMQMQHPLMMFGTDGYGMAAEGLMSTGMLHPRCFGTYPRLFGKYVRDEQVLSLEEASWKASGFPAKKLGLSDRGTIRKGSHADLVIFDPKTIRDRASYQDPLQYPVGIDFVLVNGKITLQRGKQSKMRSGRVIRRGD
jgi:N-acyl-D-amino-acid deacylase